MSADVGSEYRATAGSSFGWRERKTLGPTWAQKNTGTVVKLLDDAVLGRIFRVRHPFRDPRSPPAVSEKGYLQIGKLCLRHFQCGNAITRSLQRDKGRNRSEEHTSELQSPCNLVCRLLLEKKKNHH